MKTDKNSEKTGNESNSKFIIELWELKKFLPMSFMLTLVIFIHSILRGAKDSVLIPQLGAEMISTVKLFGVLPAAVLFVVFYTFMANKLKREHLMYFFAIFLGSFYLIFDYVLFPNLEYVTLDLGSASAPTFLSLPLKLIENWPIALFYIFAELWGSIMLNLLFWQFANDITPINQAKRFYSLFGFIGQAGLYLAGFILSYMALVGKSAPSAEIAWITTQHYIVLSVEVAIVLLLGIYYYMQNFVITDPRYYNAAEINKKPKKKKEKLSLGDSFKYIFSSKYLLLITVLVVSYGVSINLVEGVWKASINLLYPDRNDYSYFMGNYLSGVAIGTVIGMVVGAYILKNFSWKFAASMTPLMLTLTGFIFFLFLIYRNELEPAIAAIGATSLTIAVFMGALQNIASKAVKYSLFDATKEISYIPLDDELKSKGKAAVEVIGSRFGKSGGALIQFSLIAITNMALIDLSLIIFVIFIGIMFAWFYGVNALSKEFEKIKV